MLHHKISRIFYFILIGVVFTTGAVVYIESAQRAEALTLFEPFSGYETAFVPNLTAAGFPNPTCPFYISITNNDLTNGLPPEYGVFMPPYLIAPTYDYNNLITPGTPIIGGIEPVPNVACLAPFPVYPLFYDVPFYLAGTGGLPGTP